MNRTESRKSIHQTVVCDEPTMESWDRLASKLGISHSECARLALRNLALQHGIRTRSVPAHPHIIQEAS